MNSERLCTKRRNDCCMYISLRRATEQRKIGTPLAGLSIRCMMDMAPALSPVSQETRRAPHRGRRLGVTCGYLRKVPRLDSIQGTYIHTVV